MADLREQLQATLGSTYTIERELGGGGMSRVFVALDTTLGRRVVVKVIPPELAEGISVERFRREIQLAAQLQHPHIVPVHSAGESNGLPYYTMPLVEGESLRGRLARSGELPVEDAVRIFREIADALSYAHAHGVVHRDIKPENVLLSGQHALVTDFGVAKAVSAAAESGGTLTSVGIALGTPAYMAPEQASGDPNIDQRADVYAAGAVAYEMLSGRAVFAGLSPQRMIAAHALETPEPLRKHRPAVSQPLADVIMRCLEKSPADRYQSAAELLLALDGLQITRSGGASAGAPVGRGAAQLKRYAVSAGLAVAAVTALAVLLTWRRPAEKPVDANIVAVLPFRVSGAQQSLAYLREGMIDLLAAKLTGDGGPRAADPRTVMSAWRRAAPSDQGDLSAEGSVQLAKSVGAAHTLLGAVVGSPAALTISASLLAVPDGSVRAQATVGGPADSLPMLVDRLAAQLLTRIAGQSEELAGMTRSLPAIQAYLTGQAAYRRGAYHDAARSFQRSLQADSTFAIAALGLISAANWLNRGGEEALEEGLKRSWLLRDRLSARDRAQLAAWWGPHYPAPPSARETLAAWERAVEIAPDHPESWYELGDVLYHMGAASGAEHARQRAETAFRRAIQLDSSFAGATEHLFEMAAASGDTAYARTLATTLLAHDSLADHAGFIRWRLAMAVGDSAELTRIRASMPRMSKISLLRITGIGMLEGIGMGDAAAAVSRVLGRPETRIERSGTVTLRASLVFNQGRPREATAALDEISAENPARFALRLVTHAVLGSGDSAIVVRSLPKLRAGVDRPLPDDARGRAIRIRQNCALGIWYAASGNAAEALRTAQRMRDIRIEPDSTGDTRFVTPTCDAAIAVLLADASGATTLRPMLDRVDSLSMQGTPREGLHSVFLLLSARLRAKHGDAAGALAASRRRFYHPQLGTPLLAEFLKEEARAATQTGDREGAIRAYRHYLALRNDPEPLVRAEVEQMRAELDRLLRAGG